MREKTPSERQQDDYQCFAWAKGETGYDPMNPGAPVEVSHDHVLGKPVAVHAVPFAERHAGPSLVRLLMTMHPMARLRVPPSA